ncbi:hypothetical protein ACCO45_003217 [Purpureocillium lilacinum]|uniref:Uncharacterized protein n=1 Tax=Purpureocillium lilacinum TaxID=33203 RepID=A0ACC4E1Q3_PURLI
MPTLCAQIETAHGGGEAREPVADGAQSRAHQPPTAGPRPERRRQVDSAAVVDPGQRLVGGSAALALEVAFLLVLARAAGREPSDEEGHAGDDHKGDAGSQAHDGLGREGRLHLKTWDFSLEERRRYKSLSEKGLAGVQEVSWGRGEHLLIHDQAGHARRAARRMRRHGAGHGAHGQERMPVSNWAVRQCWEAAVAVDAHRRKLRWRKLERAASLQGWQMPRPPRAKRFGWPGAKCWASRGLSGMRQADGDAARRAGTRPPKHRQS